MSSSRSDVLNRGAVITGTAIVALLILVTAVSAALRLSRTGEVLPNVTVAGVDVGGLDAQAAADEVARLSRDRGARTIEFTLDGTTHTVVASEAGYAVDEQATTQAVLDEGRDGSLVGTTIRHLTATFRDEQVQLVETLDEDAARRALNEIAAEVDTRATVGDLQIAPDTLVVTVTPPDAGRAVDVDAALEALRAAFLEDGPAQLELPVEVVEPDVTVADLEQLGTQTAERLVDGITFVDEADEPLLIIAGADLAPLVGVEQGALDVQFPSLVIDPVGLAEVVGDEAERFFVPPVDARFDLERKPVTAIDDKNGGTFEPVPVDIPIIPSTPGREFDSDLAATQIAQLLTTGVNRAELELATVEAEFTVDEAEALGLTHLLGSFTTYHDCCQARVTNIQLLADMVDGTILEPGEQFSVNQISGIRTCAAGFRAAGMILNGEIVDVCGGGVSQFGTTVFNAAFFAGLQLDDWKAHSFFISRYPRGRESTLNFPDPDIDVKFTNDTEHGLLIRTSYTSRSINVSIYGQSDIASVEAIHSGSYNFRGFSTRVKENKALPPGTEKVTQSGASGFSIDITRRTTLLNGEVEDFEFTTVYVPKLKIVERNSDPPPEPEPEPEPEPSEDAPADDPPPDEG